MPHVQGTEQGGVALVGTKVTAPVAGLTVTAKPPCVASKVAACHNGGYAGTACTTPKRTWAHAVVQVSAEPPAEAA